MSGLNGTNGRMAEWQNGRMAEWQNGKMAKWQNGRMAGMVGMAGMAGMAKRQKEWQSGRMAEMATYVLFMVHPDAMYLFSTFARTYFVVLHMVQKLLGGRRTYGKLSS